MCDSQIIHVRRSNNVKMGGVCYSHLCTSFEFATRECSFKRIKNHFQSLATQHLQQKCGGKRTKHCIVESVNLGILSKVSSGRLRDLANSLENLVGNSSRLRYPDRDIPHNVYEEEEAKGAKLLAGQIVDEAKQLMWSR